MYLLVLTMLIIGVLGTYIQVVGVQTARAFSSQTAVAGAMIQWQHTAAGQAEYDVSLNQLTASGCYLPAAGATVLNGGIACIDNNTPANIVRVTPPVASGNAPCSMSASAANSVPGGVPECQYFLPPGYSSAYSFYTLAYQGSDTYYYIISYLLPPNSVTGFLNFAYGGKSLGMTNNDLNMQLRHSGLSGNAWGIVQNGSIVTNAVLDHNSVVYPGPSVLPASLPNGTIVLITPMKDAVCPSGTTRDYTTGGCS